MSPPPASHRDRAVERPDAPQPRAWPAIERPRRCTKPIAFMRVTGGPDRHAARYGPQPARAGGGAGSAVSSPDRPRPGGPAAGGIERADHGAPRGGAATEELLDAAPPPSVPRRRRRQRATGQLLLAHGRRRRGRAAPRPAGRRDHPQGHVRRRSVRGHGRPSASPRRPSDHRRTGSPAGCPLRAGLRDGIPGDRVVELPVRRRHAGRRRLRHGLGQPCAAWWAGRCAAQGRARSRSRATWSTVASSPTGAASWTDRGRPSGASPAGTDAAGWPVMLKSAQ